MSALGPTPPNSAAFLAGLNQADRANARSGEKKPAIKPDGRPRGADEVELEVQNAQAADAVRSLTSNGQEETEDDRQEKDHYAVQKKKAKQERPRLDVQG